MSNRLITTEPLHESADVRRFSAAYDACPELFLLWKLRSVMMHDNFTFLAYRYGTRVIDDTDAKESFGHLSLNLTRLRLIEGFRTQSPLTEMLERRADEKQRVEFIDVARTGLEALLALHNVLTTNTHPDLIADARTLVEFYDTYLTKILDQRNIFITQLDDRGLPRPTNLIVLSPGDFTHARTLIDATPTAEKPDADAPPAKG